MDITLPSGSWTIAEINTLLEITLNLSLMVIRIVKDGITDWINKWKLNNWKSSNRKPVKNKDLWINIRQFHCQEHKINWKWVKAHAFDYKI